MRIDSEKRFRRSSIGNVTIPRLLLLTPLLLNGCPVGDPYTESRIVNKTSKTLQIELILDKTKYGLQQSDPTDAYAQDWLEEFDRGEDVELLAIDTDDLTAQYKIASSGYMIAHSSLGTKPYIYFAKLIIRQGNKTLLFDSEKDIENQFRITEGDYYRYEFQITDADFDESDSDCPDTPTEF